MSVNSSFASQSSVECLNFRKSTIILTSFSIVNILLVLPVSILVLYLMYQRWRKQCYTCTAVSSTSHSDMFTYHMVVMEMLAVLGCLLYCVSVSINLQEVTKHVFDFFFSFWSIKNVFHTLTCLERYLAAVHPVTYLGLKSHCGVRIRNISIWCVWLLSFVWGTLIFTHYAEITILYFSLQAFATIIVSFCCISVLLALKRAGPGEVGNDRERVDQTRQRAFNTVVTITGVLLMCLGGTLVCNALGSSKVLRESVGCALIASTVWFSLPSSLVLPLLYLHRAGKLPGCKY